MAHLLRDVDDAAGHRGRVDDDSAAALCDHRSGRRLGGEEYAGDVGVLDALKLIQRHVEHSAVPTTMPALQTAMSTPPNSAVIWSSMLVTCSCWVTSQRIGTILPGTVRGDLVGDSLQRLGISRGNGHVGTGLQIRQRHSLADAAGPPGHQSPLAAQVKQVQDTHPLSLMRRRDAVTARHVRPGTPTCYAFPDLRGAADQWAVLKRDIACDIECENRLTAG